MKPVTQREIKESTFESLVIFRDFCEKNHLTYYLAFGTLLGAVRHSGYIPWDDDTDVFMPREDYDFLLRHFNEKTVGRREVIAKEICPDFYCNFGKIIDRNIRIIENRRTMEIGAWIDIFPMDYARDPGIQKREKRRIRIIERLYFYSLLRYKRERAWYKNMLVPFFRVLSLFLRTLIRKYENCKRRLKSETPTDWYGLFYHDIGNYGVPCLKKALFDPPVKLSFEGELFNAPNDYDSILRWCYGDYMTLPPKEQQVSKHHYSCSREE